MANHKTRTEQSLQRRINFAGNVKYFWASLFGKHPLKFFINPSFAFKLSGILLRISAIFFDLFESLRLGTWVKGLGDYRSTLMEKFSGIQQHKHYPTYKYIQSTNTLVGVHVGIDLIRNGGAYYLLELNLDAGIRKEMRDLYQKEIDPIITNYIEFAREHGFKRVRLINSKWSPFFVNEIEKLQTRFSIDIKLIHQFGKLSNNRDFIPGLPDKLQNDTLYVVFTSRHTPIEFLLHNKMALYSWTRESIMNLDRKLKRLKAIQIWNSFDLPDQIFHQQKWPQFVAKLSGWDRGKKILLIKAKDKGHAKKLLGINGSNETPSVFDLSPFQKIVGSIGAKNIVIYQEYIPLEQDDKGFLKAVRLHAFFSPLKNLLLTSVPMKGSRPVSSIPYGIISGDGGITPKFALNATYTLPTQSEFQEQVEVVEEFGVLLKDMLAEKFIVETE